MNYRRLITQLKLLPLLAFFFLIPSLNRTQAQTSDSFLCSERDLITLLGFATEEFHIAICKNFNTDYYYVGQSRQDSNQEVVLPVSERNNPFMDDPWILKARDGQYTYQVAEFNPLQVNGYVSISVFRNGERIYHRITDSYIRSDE